MLAHLSPIKTLGISKKCLGAILAFITMLSWSLIPITIQSIVATLEPMTITFYRMLIPFLILSFLYIKAGNPIKFTFSKGELSSLLVLSCCSFTINGVIYIYGLYYTSATVAQTILQFSHFFLALGGVIFFREKLSRMQCSGFIILTIGLIVFLNFNIFDFIENIYNYIYGVFLLFGASITSAIYALTQKRLNFLISSKTSMIFVYATGSLFYLFFSSPLSILGVEIMSLAMLLACCLLTLVAYETFCLALKYWEAARVSSTIALTPIVTYLIMGLLDFFYPSTNLSAKLSSPSIIGLILTVFGTLIVVSNKNIEPSANVQKEN